MVYKRLLAYALSVLENRYLQFKAWPSLNEILQVPFPVIGTVLFQIKSYLDLVNYTEVK